MNSNKTAILLLNVGTPDAPTVSAVRKYLFQFLNDRKVIDLPWLLQKILVNLIIVPFRAPKSTKLYKQLWDEKGSPLLYHSVSLQEKLQLLYDKDTEIFLAMRYGNPSYKRILQQIQGKSFDRLIVLPLFPQYATSTTGTAIDAVERTIAKWNQKPKVQFIEQFYSNESFINLFAEKIKAYDLSKYDHIIFSYHGLPYRHIYKVHPEHACEGCSCEQQLTPWGDKCYKATCYETTRLIATKLLLKDEEYSIGFQSRLSKNWLNPFTDELIIKIAKEGKKRILIVAPSFVTDCLETTIELGVEYKELFLENGGEHLQMVESLNDDDRWIEVVKDLIQNRN